MGLIFNVQVAFYAVIFITDTEDEDLDCLKYLSMMHLMAVMLVWETSLGSALARAPADAGVNDVEHQ